MKTRSMLVPVGALAALATSVVAQASNVLFSDNFDSDTSSLWTVNRATVNSGGNFATFNFDYSTIGIPPAPGSGGTTRGLKLEANVSGAAQTGISVSPTGAALPNEYILRFNLWHNFPGPLPAGGSGSTQVSGGGVGTAGTAAQWAGGVYDSVFFGATGDGGSSIDYRVYAVGNTASPATGYYAAGTSSNPDSRNNADPYYAPFGGQTVPAEQTALFPTQQSGQTAAGAQGFKWRDVEIVKTAETITWSIDGIRVASVPTSGLTLGGNNILLNHYDINNAISTDPNARVLLFGLFDNVMVTVVPEPSTIALLGLAGVLLGFRRWRS